jgi:hypothetical protein
MIFRFSGIKVSGFFEMCERQLEIVVLQKKSTVIVMGQGTIRVFLHFSGEAFSSLLELFAGQVIVALESVFHRRSDLFNYTPI